VTTTGRRVRFAVTLAAIGLLLLGTLVGSDDWFPFGPFRMYATSSRPTGAVRTATLVGVTEHGDEVPIRAGEVGLRRAELEGQFRRFREDPSLLEALAGHYEDRWGEPLVAVRLEEEVSRVVDRVPTGEVTYEVVAEWVR
jgi:hypothetical protein